ncbi:MAG: hypothetical protein GY882_01985 [Actinomycetia bacterium]|nr:hypothetical protein [Actinomycetes bacterium]
MSFSSANQPEASARPLDWSVLPRHRRADYRQQVEQALAYDFSSLSDDDLAAHVHALAAAQARTEGIAALAEVATRSLGLTPYPVQVLAAFALCDATVVEMATGEGKTLTSVLAAAWLAASGTHVHVMTANEYLAARDASWARPALEMLGLTTAFVSDEDAMVDRREAYKATVVYGTASRFVFDSLEDNLAMVPASTIQGSGHQFALIDEADALLIDEARTPFIVSGPAPWTAGDVSEAASWASNLGPEHVELESEFHRVSLTDIGFEHASEALGLPLDGGDTNGWSVARSALEAHYLYRRDVEYVVTDVGGGPQVVIVDEGTGRLQPSRRWRDGLHEAVEAKEGVDVRQPQVTQATTTLSSYLDLYDAVAGMTGTGLDAEEEFAHLYGLHVVPVPPHRPRIRIDHPDALYATEEEKFSFLLADVLDRNATGQPMLIGAPTVADAEQLSDLLSDFDVPHTLLTANNHHEEADIVADAGRLGAVTIATNMAGRGVDISLGGEGASAAERQAVLDAGGLCVLTTARHASRRVDEQLRGRSGRQGEPGESHFYLSAEDELVQRNCPPALLRRMVMLSELSSQSRIAKLLDKAVAQAQSNAEGHAMRARAELVERHRVLNAQATEFYAFRSYLLNTGWQAAVAMWGDRTAELTDAEPVNLPAAIRANNPDVPPEVLDELVRRLLLPRLDVGWSLHLEGLEALGDGIRLRAAGQQAPLQAWVSESHAMFVAMLTDVLATGSSVLSRVAVTPSS